MQRMLLRLAAVLASGLLGAGPARAAPAEPTSPWEALSQERSTGTSPAQVVPDTAWAEQVHRDVELTLRGGPTVVGKILRDNGGSITLVRTDQVVQVILKTEVTALRAVQLAAPPESGAPEPAPAMDREAAVDQELRTGELARSYRKGRNLAIAGGITTGVGLTLLVPGIALLSTRGRQAGPVVLTAFGGMFTFFGLSAMGAGLSKRSKTRRKAIEKVGLTPWGAPEGGGLTLHGQF